MRTLKLAAIAAGAILAVAAGGQVRGGVYDYSYTPTLQRLSRQRIGLSVGPMRIQRSGTVVLVLCTVVFVHDVCPKRDLWRGAAAPTGSCPNGCCGVNGKAAAPTAACRNLSGGNVPPRETAQPIARNGQCNSSRIATRDH